MAHGAVDGGRNRIYGWNQRLQRVVGEVGALLDQRFYVCVHTLFMLDERDAATFNPDQAGEQEQAEAAHPTAGQDVGRASQSTVTSTAPCGRARR